MSKCKGLTGDQLRRLVNRYRWRLQNDTDHVEDALSVTAYLTLTFCMELEGFDLERGLARMAKLMELLPEDARRIHFGMERIEHNAKKIDPTTH